LSNYSRYGTRNKSHSLPVLLFFGMILVLNSSYAQELKFMGGGTLSKYSNTPGIGWVNSSAPDSPIGYKSGFLAGLGAELALTKNFAFEVDALYFQKGCRFDFSDAIYDRKMEYFLDMLSFPMLLKLKILRGSSPYILGGGEFSFVLSHKSRIILSGKKMPMEDERESLKSYDIGLVLGIGFEIDVKVLSFYIEGRYHSGLRDLSKDKLYFTSLHTSALALLLGIKI
jgi:hypothetical protein